MRVGNYFFFKWEITWVKRSCKFPNCISPILIFLSFFLAPPFLKFSHLCLFVISFYSYLELFSPTHLNYFYFPNTLTFLSQWLHVQMFYSSFTFSQISSSISVSVSSFSSSQISLSNRNNKNARIFLHIASSLCSFLFLFLFFKRFCKNIHLNVLTDLMVVKASSLQQ